MTDRDDRLPDASELPPGTPHEPPGTGDGDGAAAAQPAETLEREPTISRRKWVAAALTALGVVLFAVPLLRGPAAPAESSAASGMPAAAGACAQPQGKANLDFTLKDIDGRDVRLADYKGKVVLLNFWATWCGPCKLEIPEFVEAFSAYRDRGFVILGVLSQDDSSADDLHAFAKEYGMNYPVLREHEGLGDAFGPLWAIPTSFIIDRHGTICRKHMGPVSREMLEQEIKGLL